MNILIVTSGVPFVRGGDEILAHDLCAAFLDTGHRAEVLSIPFKASPPSRILDQMLACRLFEVGTFGVTVDRVIALKFPAYLVPHPNKVVWLFHQHRIAYELWDSPETNDMIHYPDGQSIRQAIHNGDRTFLSEAKSVYTLSRNMTARLSRLNGVSSEPLYNPPRGAELFHCATAQDYFFSPCRINSVKRESLVTRALAKCQAPVRVCFAGAATPAHQAEHAALAKDLGVDDRIQWLDNVTEDAKRDWYSKCLGVIFAPLDDEYGDVALEAMLSSKPVVTCADSGSLLDFVIDGETGLIAEAAPEALARALDLLWMDRERAAVLGKAGRRRYTAMNVSWNHVVEKLTC
jgi:glycosyltransferase involved in cell wall biosynthesis